MKDRISCLFKCIFIVVIILLMVWYGYRILAVFNVSSVTAGMVAMVVIAVIMINILKALRLYIIIFGKKFGLRSFGWKYMATSFVNIITPFKLGEIYRGFSIGELLGSYAEGYIIVLFDRFIDTFALVTVSLLICVYTNMHITLIYGMMMIFLLVLLVISLSMESLYRYWNHLLIIRKNSKNTIMALKLLEKIKLGTEELKSVSSGRFLILFFLSLIAWAIEILTSIFLGYSLSGDGVNAYLIDVLKGGLSTYGVLYLLTSVAVYIMFSVSILIISKKGK